MNDPTNPSRPSEPPSDSPDILALARRHGLALTEVLDVNELGLDFRVATASDEAGVRWMLRMPRRPDVLPKIEYEARVLRFLAPRLPVAVPEWHVVAPDLVAYRRLNDRTAMIIDAATYTPTWQIDPASLRFTESLAPALVALHGIAPAEAVAAGLRSSDPEQARAAFARDLDRARGEFSIAEPLERRWRTWLDDDTSWPDFATVVHGDLYVGHILVGNHDQVTGMIDWTEAEVSDPS
ncbi:MAG: macrolide 2'-phosphotransferase, partial [Gemmatimonadales bacterium]